MLMALLCVLTFAATEVEPLFDEPILLSEGHRFSEGPVWHPSEGFLFSDIPNDTIYRGDRSVYRYPSGETNGLTIDNEGRLLACESGPKRITRTEADGSITVLADRYKGKAFNKTNDIVVRADGLIYFTDPGANSKTEQPVNGVYRLNPDTGDLTLLSDTARYPNGICLSPDGNTLYVADYFGALIRAYDLDKAGDVSNECEFTTVRNPDGFTVDTEGRLWIAGRDGVAIVDTAGKHLGLITVKSPTNCGFGGVDGTILYIAARSNVFQVKTKAKGLGKF